MESIVFVFYEAENSDDAHDFLALLGLPDRSPAAVAFSALAFFPLAIMFAISVLFSFPSPSLSWRSKAASI